MTSMIGRYRLEHELGQGSMGSVYRAHDPVLDRTVAVKTIRLDTKHFGEVMDELVSRFQHEARSAGRLKHPNIVTVYDYGEHQGVYFLVMEFVAGQTLAQRIAADGALPEREAALVTQQMCMALDAAHRAGVVHRDIKPGNMMIDAQTGLVKVMDFGIAKLEAGDLTRTGTVMGTPSYMSPEQVMGRDIDGRSDLFSLGAVFFELLTGHKAFSGENIATITYKIVNEEPQGFGKVPEQFGDGFAYALGTALAKDPTERFQTASEFRAVLETYCIGSTVPPAVPIPGALGVTGGGGASGSGGGTGGSGGHSGPPSGPHSGPHDSYPSISLPQPGPVFSQPRRNRTRNLAVGLTAAAMLLAAGLFAWLQLGDVVRPQGAPGGGAAPPVTSAAAAGAPSTGGAGAGDVRTPASGGGVPGNMATPADTAPPAAEWRLSVSTEPDGATITVADSLTLASGDSLVLIEGPYEIHAEAPGFLPMDTTIELAADTALAVALKRRPPTTGTLEVRASLPGRVSVDGQDRGRAPVTETRLRPGEYTIRFTPDVGDALAEERPVTIRIGETTRTLFDITDGLVTVAIREPRWAKVYAEDRVLGDTPLINYRLPAGVYTLRLVRDGYRTAERMVQLSSGMQFEWVDVTLESEN